MTKPHIQVTPPTPPRPGYKGFLEDAIEDIQAVWRADPAARTITEVVLTYPGLHALWLHRIANEQWHKKNYLRARMLSHYARHYTGIEIHPGATIGRRVFIDHGMGVVIGETAVVGDDCLIYKGVVLGGTSLERTKRHPTLGKGVTVGSNACILGALNIGDGARVGSGSVVVKDVVERATVVGIPGRVMSTERPVITGAPTLDHASLPDPLQRIVKDLLNHIERLSKRIDTLEANVELAPDALAENMRQHQLQDEIEQELLRNDGDNTSVGTKKTRAEKPRTK